MPTRLVVPTEQNAPDYDALILITRTSIRLLVYQQHSSSILYYFKEARYEELEKGGLLNSFYILPELAYPYRTLRVFVDFGLPYVIVPNDFDQRNLDSEVWMLHPNPSEYHTLTAKLSDPHATIIYNLPQEVYEFCSRSFVVRHFEHPIIPMINTIMRRSRLHGATILTCFICDDEAYMDVTMSHEGRLVLSNRYTVHNEVDALYYLTALWRAHDLSNSSDQLSMYSKRQSLMAQALFSTLQDSIGHLELNNYDDLVSSDSFLFDIINANDDLPPSFVFTLTE